MLEKEIEHIQAIKNKLLKFDIDFFDKKKKNTDIKEFEEKYDSIFVLLNKFDLLLKRKKDDLLLEAMERIKNEYTEYKYLKNNIDKSLMKHKVNIRKLNVSKFTLNRI